MHLESADTDLSISARQRDHSVKDTGAGHRKEAPAIREGLPPAFKMRSGRHYVEEVMGDAPLRTIREIPVTDIDPPEGGAAVGPHSDRPSSSIEQLQQSIRTHGILQPLLVAPAAFTTRRSERRATEASVESHTEPGRVEQSTRYQIISGINRYRAAVQLGLRTVPCLVCDTGAHSVEALREAAAATASPGGSPAIAAEPAVPSLSDAGSHTEPADALREVTERLAFVSAVMPALDVAGYDPLRWSTLTDLMKVEMERARSTAAALEWLSEASSASPLAPEPVDTATVLDPVLEAVGSEARLQGVKLELSSTLSGYRLAADRAMLVRALTALFQGMLAVSPAGSTLRADCRGTSVRPALILSLTQDECDIDAAVAARFFDRDFHQHPGGASGALVMAGVAHVAKLHGGRVEARAREPRGLTVTLVVPRPVDEA